ncbi:MAG TPA: lytic transglycosylase domain-containing protein [Pyrinomonadaceae bacterium]|jgi:soluble lytic murein transglycosylase-like protein|nr:lytic transglycosylase domain-containing protein [Pyrinomonadaceae bacterium]
MQITRHVPHFRSFKLSLLTIFALFLVANFTSIGTKVFAPSAAATIRARENFIPTDIPTSGDAEIDLLIFNAGKEYGVDPRLIHAVAYQESRYKPDAESHAGAQGLMQMMPATAARFAVEGKSGLEQNVYAGTKLLRWLLKRFDGDVKLALAGYNAGEGSVDKYDGIPPFKETENYVRKITANYGKTYHPILDPSDANIYFRLNGEIAQN